MNQLDFTPVLRGVATAALAIWSASAAVAGGDFTGTWQPFGKAMNFFYTMTISDAALAFADGGGAALEPVRPGGEVFRVTEVKGDGWNSCSGTPDTYVAFHVLDDGMLAFLEYQRADPPPEPTGKINLDLMDEPVCAMTFFTR